MSDKDKGDLVRRYRESRHLTQEAVAARLSDVLGEPIHQGMVSVNEHGGRWKGHHELPGAYVRALDIPAAEMMAAAGYPDPPATTAPPTLVDMVNGDPTLSAASKKHLIQQYELLQLASVQELLKRRPSVQAKRSGRSAAR